MQLRTLFVVAIGLAVPSAARAQATGLIYDLNNNTLVTTFDAGQARGAYWTSDSTAYVTQASTLSQYAIDLSSPPVVNLIGSQPLSAPAGGVPGNLLTYGAGGTRAFVPGVAGGGVAVFDLMAGTGMTQIGTIAVPSGATASASIFPGGATAVFPAGANVVFTGGLASDSFAPMTYPFVSRTGQPLNGVAAYAYYTSTTAVSLDDGGFQVLNITRYPPVPRGPVIRPDGCNYTPSLTFMPFTLTGFPCVIALCSGARGGRETVAMTDVTDPNDAFYVYQFSPLPPECRNAVAMDMKKDTGYIIVGGNSGYCSLGVPVTAFSYPAPMVVERQGIAVSPNSQYLLVVGHN